MSQIQHKSHVKEYFIIFGVLAVLTALELIVFELDIKYAIKASVIIGLAIGKAFVVAYYYMHLKDEGKMLKWIALVPISAAIYAFVVSLESIYR